MAWIWALTKLPLKTILVHGPAIVDAARSYYATTRRGGERDEPRDRETQQAALIADLAKQVQDLATTIEVLRTRLILALWGAGLAIVIAVVAIILVLRG